MAAVAEHGRSAAPAAAAQRLHVEVRRLEGRHGRSTCNRAPRAPMSGALPLGAAAAEAHAAAAHGGRNLVHRGAAAADRGWPVGGGDAGPGAAQTGSEGRAKEGRVAGAALARDCACTALSKEIARLQGMEERMACLQGRVVPRSGRGGAGR
jgi:hypothetical protein